MSNIDKAVAFRKEANEIFDKPLNFRQIWWIIKLCKTVRKFARSNAALYNLFNELFFGIAKFSEVNKESNDGKKYKGLLITMKDGSGNTVDIEDTNDD